MSSSSCEKSSFAESPFVFISYRRQSDNVINCVQELRGKLSNQKIRVVTDEDYKKTNGPQDGWTLWMQKAIEQASALVIVWTDQYRKAWDNELPLGTSNGTSWESRLIRTRIYGRRDFQNLINVVWNDSDVSVVPDFLHLDYTVYTYPQKLDNICRHISSCLGTQHTKHEKTATNIRKETIQTNHSPAYVDFRTLINSKTIDFVGRSFVFSSIDKFLSHEESGYFRIEGYPGTGKSSILSEFVKRTSSLHYFNSRADGYTSPLQFLRHISSQLIKRFCLQYEKLPERINVDHHIFGNILTDAARVLGRNQKLLIAIDALDEADETFLSSGANVLYLPSVLPPRVYFILTSRPRKLCNLPLRTISADHQLKLEDYEKENRIDIDAYIKQQIPKMELHRNIHKAKLTEEEFTDILADRSENNFMYIFHMLRAIRKQSYDIHYPESLPRGLSGYYEDHWKSMNASLNLDKQGALVRILYYLCELRRPVSTKELSKYTKESLENIDHTLTSWDQFLLSQRRNGELYYSLYHSSFRDFLHKEKIVLNSNISIEAVNRDIASRTLEFLGIRRRLR